MRFLAIGECMAELSPVENTGAFNLGFAGDTFNTAWYLARVCPQLDVSYFTAVGNDAISHQMRLEIRNGGIDDSFIQTMDDATVGLYLISLENGERSFSYWRGQSAARQMLQDPSRLEKALSASDLIYFSGITLAILCATQRNKLIEALAGARNSGKTIAFDPNLRPRLWTKKNEMLETVMLGASVSDVVLPSFEDEAEYFNDANPEATAQRYVDAGAKTVVVKNGPEPVLFSHLGEVNSVPVTPLPKVVDTTAAGDSFNAEILAGIAEGTPLAESIELACNLAAIVVQGRGALVPIDLDQIER